MKLEIIRIEKTAAEILGVLLINDAIFCYTLEPAWKDNKENISCIPDGNYVCIKYLSPKTGFTLKILNVLDRTDIIFHVGNTWHDTSGCILLGSDIGKLGKGRAILKSKNAINKFRKVISNEDNFSLIISGGLR